MSNDQKDLFERVVKGLYRKQYLSPPDDGVRMVIRWFTEEHTVTINAPGTEPLTQKMSLLEEERMRYLFFEQERLGKSVVEGEIEGRKYRETTLNE